MNINKPLIVASLVVLASSPAFAAHNKSTYTTDRQQTYMTTGAVSDQVLRANAVLNQNSAVNDNCTINWQDRVFVGGLINVDGIWSDRDPALLRGAFTNGSESTDLVVNNANLFVDAKVNNWVKAHMNLMYAERPDVDYAYGYNYTDFIVLSNDHYTIVSLPTSAYFTGSVEKDRILRMDEAYIDINNFAQTPFFLRAGKQYVAFGDYPNYPILPSMTQLMSQTDQTALSVGAITDFGPYINIFAFNGVEASGDDESNINDFGVKIGWYNDMSSMGLNGAHFNIDASWIRNIFDTDFFDSSRTSSLNLPHPFVGNTDRAQAIAAHVDFSYQSWDFWANYTAALDDMLSDFGKSVLSTLGFDPTENTKLWAGDVNGSYAFRIANYESKVGLSYQFAGHGKFFATTAEYFAMHSILPTTITGDPFPLLNNFPKNRFTADFSISPCKNTSVTALYAHNESFSYFDGSRDSNVGIIRLSVNF